MSANKNINYATVAAFERTKAPERKHSSMRFLSLMLMAVFFIVLMIGLASGVRIYQQVAGAQRETNDLHIQSGLISNTIHMNDFANAVSSGVGPEGVSLVLTEEIGGEKYETRLYLYDHHLVQEYAIAGRDYNPMNARELIETNLFDFSYDKGLLTIVTDQGSVDVAIRSAQGGR